MTAEERALHIRNLVAQLNDHVKRAVDEDGLRVDFSESHFYRSATSHRVTVFGVSVARPL